MPPFLVAAPWVVERILEALAFVESAGASGGAAFKTVELYSSHEGLILPWEEAQTEQIGGKYYNLGAHMLWIGHRTRSLDGAHVDRVHLGACAA